MRISSRSIGCSPAPPVAGRAYFITQGEPWPIRDVIDGPPKASGAPVVTRTVKPWVAYLAGALFEVGYRLVGRSSEPPITRFVAHQLSTSHWYDISAARRDLGYEPSVSIREALDSLAACENRQVPELQTVSSGSIKSRPEGGN